MRIVADKFIKDVYEVLNTFTPTHKEECSWLITGGKNLCSCGMDVVMAKHSKICKAIEDGASFNYIGVKH